MRQRRVGRHRRSIPAILGVLIVAAGVRLTVRPSQAAGERAESGPSAEQPRPTRLETNATHQRELRAGDTHRFDIDLERGQYLRLVLDQRQIDLRARCLYPDGSLVREVDARDTLRETVSVIADPGGTYHIEVSAADALSIPRGYAITVDALRPAEAPDHDWRRAEALSSEAKRQLETGTAEGLGQARARYEEARALWLKVGDRLSQADTVGQLGVIAYLLGDSVRALTLYEAALSDLRAVHERVGEGAILANIAAAHSALGDKARAVRSYEEALTVARSVEDRRRETLILGNLGAVHYALGNPTSALAYANEALAMARARGDRHWEAQALNTIAGVHSLVGDNERALEIFRQVADAWRATGDRRGEAIATANMGTPYLLLGDVRRAAVYQDDGARLLKALGDRRSAALVLVSAARSYEQLGDLPRALERLEEALAGARAVSDRRAEAIALTGLGHVQASQGSRDHARDTYLQALPLIRSVGDRLREAVLLSDLGDLSYSQHDWPGASASYAQALPLARAASDRNGEAAILLNLARCDLMARRFADARDRLDQALAIVERLRGRVTSPELRATYLAAKGRFYETAIQLHMAEHAAQPDAGHDARALQAAERARARSLLELLVEARADIRQGVDAGLLERERALSQHINAKASRQMALQAQKHTEPQGAALSRDLERLLEEYRDVQARIRATSPHYAALMQPEPLTMTEIQRQVLDPDTALLEYALGDERSYAWVLTTTALHSIELPKRGDIEPLARRVHDLVAARPAPAAASATRHRVEGQAPARALQDAARSLSRLILDPVASALTARRILIVADGALHYVPFAALPMPAVAAHVGTRRQSGDTPMLTRHEVVMLPSASTLTVLRRELAGRAPAPRTVAVLADPVFHPDDRRVGRVESRVLAGEAPAAHPPGSEAHPNDLARAMADIGVTGPARLPRLPFSRREAEAILAQVPRRLALRALDFAANRATATGPTLRQYRILHIATHGFLNATHPELSGLVLSLVDEMGRPRDGFLRLHDVYNIALAADLVVLSACQSGLGQEIKGEGIVGLTRGFMYAGAARVLVSLWRVDDEATAALMARFYAGVLGPRRLAPAEALRRAQLDLSQQPRWRAPYYWAGFVLQGEYRPAESAAAPSRTSLR